MAEVNEALTRKIADLARLELTEVEVRTFTSQLGGILGYVDQLTRAHVEGVEPMVHPFDLPTPMREDVVRPSPVGRDGRPKMIQPAPELEGDGFRVPQVL